MTLYLITVGFKESSALRALLRRGIKEKDEFCVLQPNTNDRRAEQAISSFERIIHQTIPLKLIMKTYRK